MAEKCSFAARLVAHVPARVPGPSTPRDPDLDEERFRKSQFRRDCEAGQALRRELAPSSKIGGRERPSSASSTSTRSSATRASPTTSSSWPGVRRAGPKRNGIGVGPGRRVRRRRHRGLRDGHHHLRPARQRPHVRALPLARSAPRCPISTWTSTMSAASRSIEHVRQLYGPERVCHVITYSTIKAKQAINDARARARASPVVVQGQKLSKMTRQRPQAHARSHALHKVGEGARPVLARTSRTRTRTTPTRSSIIDAALSIEGMHPRRGRPRLRRPHLPRRRSTTTCPPSSTPRAASRSPSTRATSVADMGLLKMDFLGLRTLTVISKALANIKANHGIDINVDEIPFDDPEIYRAHARGPHGRRLPGRVRRHDVHDQEHAPHRVQARRRPHRALPPGPLGRRHGRRATSTA